MNSVFLFGFIGGHQDPKRSRLLRRGGGYQKICLPVTTRKMSPRLRMIQARRGAITFRLLRSRSRVTRLKTQKRSHPPVRER